MKTSRYCCRCRAALNTWPSCVKRATASTRAVDLSYSSYVYSSSAQFNAFRPLIELLHALRLISWLAAKKAFGRLDIQRHIL